MGLQFNRKLTYIETIYGGFWSWEGELFSRQFQAYSAHTRNELALLKHFIEPGQHILDIGAHIGSFSIPFSCFMQKRGMVYAFEPQPDNYALLLKNIQSNQLGHCIQPYQAVVAIKSGQSFSLDLPEKGNSGMFYCLPSRKPSQASVTSINLGQWYQQQPQQYPIDLIKIDVEGAELAVLYSAYDLIARFRPVLYIEMNRKALKRFKTPYQDIQKLLSDWGYAFFRNIGPRNSTHDQFRLAHLQNLEDGGGFYDLLAVHSADPRCPQILLT